MFGIKLMLIAFASESFMFHHHQTMINDFLYMCTMKQKDVINFLFVLVFVYCPFYNVCVIIFLDAICVCGFKQ